MKNILKIENITKEYKIASKKVIALNNISLNVQTGDCLAIVGESGSGKTTLGRLILGLENPTKGNIFYNSSSYVIIKTNIIKFNFCFFILGHCIKIFF